MLKKSLAVAVILLFIVVAFAPGIYANISKEMIEFTTEICGLNDGKHTVKLTQQEAGEVEALFDSIRERLNATETREGVEEVFKEAVVELDKYGLLGGLSVKKAQRLVTGGYQNSRVIDHINKLDKQDEGLFDSTNFFCLVAGSTSITVVMNPRAILLCMLSRMNKLREGIASLFNYLFFISLEISTFFIPILFLDTIFLGGINKKPPLPRYVSAEGWISSIGLIGRKNWNGSLFGGLPFPPLPMQLSHWEVFPGILGLTGIKWCWGSSEIFFLGSALWVKIISEPP